MFKNLILSGIILLISLSTGFGQKLGEELPPGSSNTKESKLFTTIVPIDGRGSIKLEYGLGEHIYIKVLMVNTGTNNLNLPKGNNWYRPRLVMNEQVIPYSSETMERIREQEKRAAVAREYILLEPKKPNEEIFDISEWYGSLETGIYELSIQRDVLGQQVESNKVTFMITH